MLDGKATPTPKPKAHPAKPKTAKPAGRSLADFRKEYDKDTIVPAKLKAAIEALGQDGWEYEVPFAKQAGVSLADLSTYRDSFAAYVVTVRRDGKRVWAGSTKLAKQRREIVT